MHDIRTLQAPGEPSARRHRLDERRPSASKERRENPSGRHTREVARGAADTPAATAEMPALAVR